MTGVPQWMRNRRTSGVAALAVVGAALVAVVVLVLAPAAGAQEGPDVRVDEEGPEVRVDEEIECADSNWLLPGGGGTVQLVFAASMPQEWAKLYVNQARQEAEQGNCRLAEWEPYGRCVRGSETEHQAFLPDYCWSGYPAASYNITYDTGSGLFDWWPQIWGTLTGFTFYLGKLVLHAALWVVGVAYGFDIKAYTGLADSIAGRYDARLVGPFKLREIAWTALFAYVAVTAVRGRLGIAGGEVVLSLVLATLATVLVGHRVDYMNPVIDRMDDASVALLVAARDQDPAHATRADAQAAVSGMSSVLYEQFIGAPYYFLQWGGIPDEGTTPEGEVVEGACHDRAEFILTVGLHDDGGWAGRYMLDQNGASDVLCTGEVTWYNSGVPERWGAALVSTVTVIAIGIVLGLTALTLFVGKLLVAVMFAVVPFAAAAATLPGTGRRWAWGWLSTTLQGVLVFVGSAGVLSLGGLGIAGITQPIPEDRPWERTLLVFALVVLLFVVRRRVLTGSQSAASKLSDNLTRLSPASANWQGGGSGFDLSGLDRNMGRAGWATGAAVGIGARWMSTRIRDRRQIRRSLRNLEVMERRRERPYLEYSHDPNPSAAPSAAPSPKAKVTVKGGRGGTGGHGGAGGGFLGRGGSGGAGSAGSRGGEATVEWSGGGAGSGEPKQPQPNRNPKTNLHRPKVTMKVRAPRSFKPTWQDAWPTRWGPYVRRLGQAPADRFRLGKSEQRFEKMTGRGVVERRGWRGRDLKPSTLLRRRRWPGPNQ